MSTLSARVPTANPASAELLNIRIDALSWEQISSRIMRWAQAGDSRVVCVCNVHSLMTAKQDPELFQALANADLCTPDGAPLAWLMRQQHWPEQQRISGPELMWHLLGEASRLQQAVFLLGGTPETLDKLHAKLHGSFPSLRLVGSFSPPFRALTAEENQQITDQIRQSGATLLLVGLGCPKQEKWMTTQRGHLPAVMVGVGAAFDYHAGTLPRAPLSWQHAGLEWLYRLAMEPIRLSRRYLVTNTLFLLALPGQLWKRSRR